MNMSLLFAFSDHPWKKRALCNFEEFGDVLLNIEPSVFPLLSHVWLFKKNSLKLVLHKVHSEQSPYWLSYFSVADKCDAALPNSFAGELTVSHFPFCQTPYG